MRPRRTWAAVAATLVLSAALLPPGVAIVGAVLGGLSSLLAIGLVLAYRAHRFLNLAHAALGGVAGSLVSYLVAHAGWSFWIAFPTGLAAGAVIGVVTGMLLGERLGDASRTTVVAASLALAFIFGAAHVAMGLATGSVLAFEVPFPLSFEVFPVRLSGTHTFAALIVPIALAAVWVFLQRTDYGLRVRALAGSVRHARRIGVDPHTSWRILWLVIGLLAATAGIASQPLLGTTVARGPLLGPLLLALAAAAVAGMRDVALTIGACVALGVAYQAILWRSPVAAMADVALFVVIIGAFAMRAAKLRLDERNDPPRHRLVRSLRPAPDRLGRILAVGRLVAAAVVVIAAVVIVPTLAPGDAQRVGAIGVFVLAGLVVHVLATYRGSLTFGAWAIVGVGALVAGRVGGGSLAGVGAAILAAAGVSVAIALLAKTGGPLAYATITLAGAVAFGAAARYLPVGAARVAAIGPISLDDPANVAVIILATSACVAVALGYLRRTQLGRDAIAVREDPRLAATHGIRSVPTTLTIDFIAGAVAGLAGALYLWNQRVVHPDAFQAVRSLELVAITITGGIGSVLGPFLGSAVVKGSELFASGPLHLFATGAGLLVVVVWLRGGLVSLGHVLRERVRGGTSARPAPLPTPEIVARFCPAPAAETRKARHNPIVRRLAVTAVVVCCAGGIALRPIVSGHRPATVVWLAAATFAAAAFAAALGHVRPHLVGGAAVVAAASAAALLWSPAMLAVPIAAGYVIGSTLHLAGANVPHSLVHAARGWIGLQAIFGIVAGVAATAAWGPGPWIVVAAVAGVVVAANAAFEPARAGSAPGSPDGVLTVADAAVNLGGTDVLRGASLHVRRGEIVGIVGANGAGKTTLLRCIAGEIALDAGSVFVRHTDATILAPEERFTLGVMLSDADDGSNGELTVRENLRLAALAAHDRSPATEAVDAAGGLHPSLRNRLDDRAAVLSGGERRVLALAQIAIALPEILLVDELARGLSGEAIDVYRAVLQGLAARGTAILVVDHDAARLRLIADRTLRLQDGRLAPFEDRAASLAAIGTT